MTDIIEYRPVTDDQDTAGILDRQLAACADLIGNLSQYVMRSDTSVETCLSFMDRISAMLVSCATVGKTTARLRGGTEETRHRMIVEHVKTGEGMVES
ncbi:MAG TPA: hypothetical protein VHW02_08315 [Rhizomicrobium sp.]|jgi:hypothetical protein|nr:hypothetical protein [Rhizomicrobium sp.]